MASHFQNSTDPVDSPCYPPGQTQQRVRSLREENRTPFDYETVDREARKRHIRPLHRSVDPDTLARIYEGRDWLDQYREQIAEQDANDVALIVGVVAAVVLAVGLLAVILP